MRRMGLVVSSRNGFVNWKWRNVVIGVRGSHGRFLQLNSSWVGHPCYVLISHGPTDAGSKPTSYIATIRNGATVYLS